MARPVDAEWPISQLFAGLATRGVIGRPDGNQVEYLVWLYGDYQPYGHAGVDIACPVGTPIYAMNAGTVVFSGWGEDLPGNDTWGPAGYFRRWGMYKNFPGIVTVIKHRGANKFDIYGHQSNNDAAPVGLAVEEGQFIGLSGDTKTRTEKVGAHLHVVTVADPVNYSTDWPHRIYGCEDPTPYFGSTGPVLQGALTNAAATQAQEEDHDMLTIYRDTAAADPDQTWIGNALFKSKVRDPQHLADLQLMAREGKMSIAQNGDVQTLPDSLFGIDIGLLLPQVQARAVITEPFRYLEPRTGEPKGTTTIENALGGSDLQHVATRDEVAE